MARLKTLTKRKKYMKNTQRTVKLRKDTGLIAFSPTKELLNEKLIAEAVWECLKNNDPEGVLEIIHSHLDALNKSQIAKENHIPRSSLYSAFKTKNPTIKTLSKLVNCCTH